MQSVCPVCDGFGSGGDSPAQGSIHLGRVGVSSVSADTLAEDTDLALALNRAGWRVVYEEQAQAWTEAPSTLGQLWPW